MLPSNVNSITLQLMLGGYNGESFELSKESLELAIVNKDPTVEPLLILTLNRITSTEVDVQVNINTDGTLFWHLFVNQSSTPAGLVDLKIRIKENQNIIQQTSDLSKHIGLTELDERVDLMTITTSSNTNNNLLYIKGLHPETEYIFCGYFQTEFKRVQEEPICTSFVTLSNFTGNEGMGKIEGK